MILQKIKDIVHLDENIYNDLFQRIENIQQHQNFQGDLNYFNKKFVEFSNFVIITKSIQQLYEERLINEEEKKKILKVIYQIIAQGGDMTELL